MTETLSVKSTEDERVANEAVQNTNRELLLRIKEGDQDALDELVVGNMGLVRKVAVHFISSGVELEDLIQIGVIGMIKAARSFDFSFDTVFSTYAVPMIMGEIRRFIRDDGPIKIGRELKTRGAKLMNLRDRFIKEHGREPKLSELSELSGLCEQDIILAMEAGTAVCSLNEPISGDDEGLTLEGSIPDKESGLEAFTDKLALNEAIRTLPTLWRKIIALRYYNDLSQFETGKRLGLTQVKISREEQKILNALRSSLIV